MPLKKKSKFINKIDHERLLLKFYYNLNNKESHYLRNVFENEDGRDFANKSMSGRKSNPDDEIDMDLYDNIKNIPAAIDDPTHAQAQIFFDLNSFEIE